MLLERGKIDFNISKNLLIKEIEDEFIKTIQFKKFSSINYSQYKVKYYYIENKKAFQRMLIQFYIEHQNITDEICNIGNIKKAKIKINKLISNINTWFEKFIKTEAIKYEKLLVKV